MEKYVDIDFGKLFCNLLITLRQNGINEDKISYSLVDEYGSILMDNLNKRGIHVHYILDNDTIDTFLSQNKEYYEDSKIDGSVIILKRMAINEMILKYQLPLSAYILRSIFSQDVVTRTLEACINELSLSNEKTINKLKTIIHKRKTR